MSPFSRAIAVSRDARGGPPDAVFFDTLRISIISHPSVRNDRCELGRVTKEFLKATHLQFRVSLGIIKDDSEAVRARIHLLGELRSVFLDDSLKGNPAGPGGSSKTKPTWSKPRGRSTASAFFSPACGHQEGLGRRSPISRRVVRSPAGKGLAASTRKPWLARIVKGKKRRSERNPSHGSRA